MLEWKTIKIKDKSFIGMHMILPMQGIYIISSTKCILVGSIFHIEKMTPSSCVFIMSKSDCFQSLLESKVINMNEYAIHCGYRLNMSGKEVLLYQSQREDKKKI